MKWWKVQYQDESQLVCPPTDAAGVERMRSRGCEWINQRDGKGWRPISFVHFELEFQETLESVREVL